jgi:hypothetical protein
VIIIVFLIFSLVIWFVMVNRIKWFSLYSGLLKITSLTICIGAGLVAGTAVSNKVAASLPIVVNAERTELIPIYQDQNGDEIYVKSINEVVEGVIGIHFLYRTEKDGIPRDRTIFSKARVEIAFDLPNGQKPYLETVSTRFVNAWHVWLTNAPPTRYIFHLMKENAEIDINELL